MRTANVIVSSLGIAGVVAGAAVAWRWRRTPLIDATRPAVETSGRAALDGIRTLAVNPVRGPDRRRSGGGAGRPARHARPRGNLG